MLVEYVKNVPVFMKRKKITEKKVGDRVTIRDELANQLIAKGLVKQCIETMEKKVVANYENKMVDGYEKKNIVAKKEAR